MLSSEIIYYSQLDGYVIKSVLTRLYQKVKDNLKDLTAQINDELGIDILKIGTELLKK